MAKTKEPEFNPNPPLQKSNLKYMVLRNKENNAIFWTSGGEYRIDWYDLLFHSDDIDEVKDYYMKVIYSPKKPL